MQAAGVQHHFMALFPFGFQARFIFSCRIFNFRQQGFPVAAEQNVRAAAGHVGGNRHRLRRAGLGNNVRFALMLLGVQNFMRNAGFLQLVGKNFRSFNGRRADQDRRNAGFMHALNFLNNRVVFAVAV